MPGKIDTLTQPARFTRLGAKVNVPRSQPKVDQTISLICSSTSCARRSGVSSPTRSISSAVRTDFCLLSAVTASNWLFVSTPLRSQKRANRSFAAFETAYPGLPCSK